MKNKFHTTLILIFILAQNIFAQKFPEQSNPPRLVNDFANVLSPDEKNRLEEKLVYFNDTTSTQIAIVLIHSLDGYPIDDYTFGLGNKWGIGQKKKNNGILILAAIDDHEIFIATGYGVEGALPDAHVKHIVENDIKPSFRDNNFYEGLDKATDSMIQLVKGEYTADEIKVPRGSWIPFLMFFVVFLFIIFFKINSTRRYASLNNIPFWVAWSLLNAASRKSRGSWGGFTSGGGSWGGGGGGFGGFGGGSFGGGGAGGKW